MTDTDTSTLRPPLDVADRDAWRAEVRRIATEVGMLHRLRRANRDTDFQAINPKPSCRFMKVITARNLITALRNGRDQVTVDPEIAGRAHGAVSRMIEIGRPGVGE